MIDPIFKPGDQPLSEEEENSITRNLAEAYRLTEQQEKTPEFQRIVQKIVRLLDVGAKHGQGNS
ncbi:MAG: hypothetical protein WCO60_07150 [Verrucomicrobiota bacterium]